MDNLNDMVIFAKVAELQGVSSAARALRMPKSKVSRRMAALEDDLGVRLLERSTRSVHLSELGEIFYQHCRRVVEEATSARESVNRMLDAPRGCLRISASVAIGQRLIAPWLGEFMTAFPEVEIDMSLTNRRVDVIGEGFDLAVRVGAIEDSTLVSKRLGADRAHLFASSDYLKQRGTPTRLSDLKKHRLLAMQDTAKPGQWTLAGPGDRREIVAIQPHGTANDLTTLRHIAAGGGGIALLPRYMARESRQQRPLRRVLPAWATPEFSFYALYPSRRGVTQKLRAWLDFFSGKLAGRAAGETAKEISLAQPRKDRKTPAKRQ